MYCVSNFSGVSLLLLLPTAFLWIAVVINEQFGFEQPLELLTKRSPDMILVGLALVLPFAAILLGMSCWQNGNDMAGLFAALVGTLFLAFSLIATIWPHGIQSRHQHSLT